MHLFFMNTKTQRLKNNNLEIFPFDAAHLKTFRKELDKAGNFHELMIQKGALEIKNGMKYIKKNYDIEGYKRKFLKGAYKTLRDMYDTDMPFIFWSDLHDLLLKIEGYTK
jgi:phage-related protein